MRSRPLIHPVFVAYTGGLYVLGAVIGLRSGGAALVPLVAWGFWYAFGASALGIVVNDYFDRDLDAHNPRKHQFERVYTKAAAHRYASAGAAAALSAVALLFVFFSPAAAWCLAAFAAGTWAYNAPPLRLKERPGPDVLVGPASFAVPLIAGYALSVGAVPAPALLAAAALFFSALELFHKTFDIETDHGSRVRTAAVVLGLRASLLVCAALEIGAAALVAWFARDARLLILVLPYLAILGVVGLQSGPAERRALYGAIRVLYVVLGTLITMLMFLKLS